MNVIHLRHGSVSASSIVVAQIKTMLVRFDRGYFPTRGNADNVRDRLAQLATINPKEFTKNSLELLGA